MSRKKKDPEKEAEALREEELEEVSGGMFPASTTGGSGLAPAAPDVCTTPSAPGPVPIPYPNTSSIADSDSTTKKTKVDGSPMNTKG